MTQKSILSIFSRSKKLWKKVSIEFLILFADCTPGAACGIQIAFHTEKRLFLSHTSKSWTLNFMPLSLSHTLSEIFWFAKIFLAFCRLLCAWMRQTQKAMANVDAFEIKRLQIIHSWNYIRVGRGGRFSNLRRSQDVCWNFWNSIFWRNFVKFY